MKIGVIGSGYVGLVSGACFSEFGYDVTCIDKDQNRIDALNKGIIPIYEPGLDAMVSLNASKKRLHFSVSTQDGVKDKDIVLIAVGTPIADDGSCDLTYVLAAAEDIAPYLSPYTIVVTKSTVPVGTSERIKHIIQKKRPDLKVHEDFDVASNPEFLREGSAINDFMRPDRVVIGTDSPKAEKLMKRLYRPLYLIETPIVSTDIASSELSKYASNGFLATKIAFINEIANLCERSHANVQDVAKAMGLDGRIGRKFLNAGPGYGGSCFPKDTNALAHIARELNSKCSIIESVIASNQTRKKHMAQRILKHTDVQKIAILGVTFKPNTDDLRDAPSLDIIDELLKARKDVCIYDPLYYKGSSYESLFPIKGVQFASDAYEAAHNADAVIILTEWNEFRSLDLEKIAILMKHKRIFDFRNIYKNDEVFDFYYESIGRKTID